MIPISPDYIGINNEGSELVLFSDFILWLYQKHAKNANNTNFRKQDL